MRYIFYIDNHIAVLQHVSCDMGHYPFRGGGSVASPEGDGRGPNGKRLWSAGRSPPPPFANFLDPPPQGVSTELCHWFAPNPTWWFQGCGIWF